MKTLNKFVSKPVDSMNGLNPITEHIFCFSFRDSITSLSYSNDVYYEYVVLGKAQIYRTRKKKAK